MDKRNEDNDEINDQWIEQKRQEIESRWKEED